MRRKEQRSSRKDFDDIGSLSWFMISCLLPRSLAMTCVTLEGEGAGRGGGWGSAVARWVGRGSGKGGVGRCSGRVGGGDRSRDGESKFQWEGQSGEGKGWSVLFWGKSRVKAGAGGQGC